MSRMPVLARTEMPLGGVGGEPPSARCPRLMLCGLRGSSGKTLIALGLIGAWTARGIRVAPF